MARTRCFADRLPIQPNQTPSLPPVALPDISRAAEPVQKQIRDRYQSLQAAIDRRAAPSELARGVRRNGKAVHRRRVLRRRRSLPAERAATCARRYAMALLTLATCSGSERPGESGRLLRAGAGAAPDHVPSLVWLADVSISRRDRTGRRRAPREKRRSLDPPRGAVLYGLGRVALAMQDYAQR